MSLSMTMTAGVERGLRTAVLEFTREAVSELCRRGLLTGSVDEALAALNLDSCKAVSSRSKASTKREAKSAGVGRTKKPGMIVPCCGEVVNDWCMGVKFNHGLHTQCTNGPLSSGEYCKTCQKQADCSATGKPPYGDIRARVSEGVDYRDPKGKLTLPYANVAEKMGLDIDAAKVEASKFGWTIPDSQLTKRVTKRGRPAKSAAVSDTDSETSEKPVLKKRGRKPKKKVAKATDEDQIAALVAEAYEEETKVSKSPKKPKMSAAEKEAAKAAKLAEKEAAKAAKLAEKEAAKVAKLAEKEAAKVAKLAEKEAAKVAKKEAAEKLKAEKKAAKVAEKEAAKAAKVAEKEAAKAVKVAEKEAAKAAKLAEKAAKKKTTKVSAEENITQELAKMKIVEEKQAVIEEPKELEEEEVDSSDDEGDEYSTLTVDGVEYYQVEHESGQIVVLSKDTEEPIGIYDAESKTIQECEFGDSSDDEDED